MLLHTWRWLTIHTQSIIHVCVYKDIKATQEQGILSG